MTLTDLADIHFYIDGELGPEEASEVEARFERDTREIALFEVLWRQKQIISEALDALEAACSENSPVIGLAATLAGVLSRRLAQPEGSPIGHSEPTGFSPDG